MQDDTTKRPTVEDQELADMIANLNNTSPTSAPIGATPTTPSPAPTQTSTPSPLTPPPAPIGATPPQAPTGDNFNIPEPTPGLPPLPTAGTPLPDAPASNQTETNDEKFEPPVSNLPPLGHKDPLPPLPDENKDPDADINEIGANLSDLPKPGTAVKVSSGGDNNELNAIKQDALNKLRPLVDELDLSAQEKFDTLLLLIRSNDDKSLIPQAYEVADQIENETARAAALLDIVKEIDFFENSAS